MQKERIISLVKSAMRISFMHAFLITAGSLGSYAGPAEAQGALEAPVVLEAKRVSLKSLLEEVESQAQVTFVYSPSAIDADKEVFVSSQEAELDQVLKNVLDPLEISYHIKDSKVVLVKSKRQETVKGTIRDAGDNSPLPGVSVLVKGTNNGVLTNESGNFSIEANSGDVLVVSYIGYTPQELPVTANQEAYNVNLVPATSDLDEVVVTGYAAQRKRDLTGAVSVVNVDDMNRQPTGQVTNQLQGQASGVTVIGSGQPGREPQIRIRGLNTFGDNTPLYVVDGVPIQNIADLNPNDIESTQVLKDAGAASIYGSRAANGVIIITTRRGSREDKVKINYDMYYGTQRPISGNIWDIASPIDNARLQWMAQRNSGVTPGSTNDLYGTGTEPVLPDYILPQGAMEGDPRVNPDLYFVNPNYFNASDVNDFYRINRANHAGTDWANEIFQNAPITSHNLAVSNGTEKGSYLFSMNYFNQEGVLKNTYLERYTIRANSSYNFGNNIRIGENITYSLRRGPSDDGVAELDEGNAIGMSYRQAPIIPVYDIMGNYAGSSGGGLGNANNPVAQQDRIRNNNFQNGKLLGNVFAEADFLDHFTLRTSFGGEYNSGYSHWFTFPEYENIENGTINSYTENAVNSWNWTWTNTLTYRQNFNEAHDLMVVLGTEAYQENFRLAQASTQGYFSFDPDYTDLGTGFGAQTAFSDRAASSLFSYIGRIDYNYRQRYLLGATIRRDASSKFLENQVGWFPAFSAGWRISEEAFMENTGSWLNDLKIRGGYGIMGNQLNVDYRNSFFTFSGLRRGSYYDITGSSANTVLGLMPFRIGNPDARWEKNISSNIGFDAALFGGQLEINADYYRKDIQDLLFNPAQPGTAGQAFAPFVNIAQMKNTGFDVAVTGRFDLGSDLKLTTTGTLTTYHNEIVAVSESSNYFDVPESEYRYNGNYVVRNSVGNPMGSFFGYKVDGFWNSQEEIDAANAQARQITGNDEAVYQSEAAPGRFRYQDTDGDGQITADDRTVLGNPNPDFNYGLNIGLTYKNWDFNAFLYGVAGAQIYNNVRWYTDFYSSFLGSANSNTAAHNSWTPDNPNARAPIQETSGTFSTSNVPNSYFIENGSYLRLRNVSVGYTFPKDWLSRARIERLRIYVQGANLFTITPYSGPDPEITGSTTAFGIDQGAYITPRQIVVGLNVGF